MIYDASDPAFNHKSAVSIPGIGRMLVVGRSPTAMNFSSDLSYISKFDNIYYSKDIESAVELLKSVKVSIVIIDGDADFDPVSCSRLIKVQNALARIILISTKLDHTTVINMKNNGIIHGFILLPCDIMFAHTIILQEEAKYHIDQTLRLILKDPPAGTPLYNKLKQSSIYSRGNPVRNFSLVAISIVHETVSLYNYVVDHNFKLDPILFSSYFSAISLFSERMIAKSGKLESFEFNNQVVFVRSIDGVQYIFVMKDITEENRPAAEKFIFNVTQRLFLVIGEELKDNGQVDDEQALEELIDNQLPSHQKPNVMEAEYKPQIINIHEPSPELANFYDEVSRAYEVTYVDDEEQLFDLINDASYEIVILNNFEDDFTWNKYLLNIVKDESPFTQSIACIGDMDNSNLSGILNVNDLDLVVDESFQTEDYFGIFRKAIERSKSIQEGLTIDDLNKMYRLKNNPEMLKAMLRRNSEQEGITQPKFYLMYIMHKNKKFYSYYNQMEDEIIEVDEELFFGFIDSLLTFTDELKNSPLMFSGVKYGNSNIIVERKLNYYFIYFVGDLDQTNFEHISDELATVSHEIYNVIRYDVDPHNLSDGLGQLIDDICDTIGDRLTIEDQV